LIEIVKSYNSLRPTEFSDYLHDLKATANPLAPLEETKSEDVSPVRLDTKSSSAFEKPKDQVFVEKSNSHFFLTQVNSYSIQFPGWQTQSHRSSFNSNRSKWRVITRARETY